MASSQVTTGSERKNFFLEEIVGIASNCPGKWLSYHHDVQMCLKYGLEVDLEAFGYQWDSILEVFSNAGNSMIFFNTTNFVSLRRWIV